VRASAVRIASDWLTAEIAARGAELVGLATSQGRELLWHGDPLWWTGRSPLLFPIVGKVPGDRLLIDGKEYDMPQHGFARRMDFALLRADPSSCLFELRSSSETLQCYPFPFALRVAYRISDRALAVTATVCNEGEVPMPMSFGYHPAFRWPLSDEPRREAYELQFEFDEPDPVPRLIDGLLSEQRVPSPVAQRRLQLSDGLFENGAIVFDALRSRWVTYGTRAAPMLRVRFPEMPHLGVWSKPGAPFVCIEPWQGYAAPVGFAGQLHDKPGIVLVLPGASKTYEMAIELVAHKLTST
jgi:galactose mutarotase-like enzyme